MDSPSRSDGDFACFVIRDEDDSPQRYPLIRLLRSVDHALGGEVRDWRVMRLWGQGLRTGRLEDRVNEIELGDDIIVTTELLLSLDRDPNEWFYDVIIRTLDRSLSLGIFDSGFMFVEGPAGVARAAAAPFELVEEAEGQIDTDRPPSGDLAPEETRR